METGRCGRMVECGKSEGICKTRKILNSNAKYRVLFEVSLPQMPQVWKAYRESFEQQGRGATSVEARQEQ